MRLYIYSFSLTMLFLPASSFGEVSIRGNVKTLWASDTNNDDSIEHLFEGDTRLFAEGRLEKEHLSATLSFLSRFVIAGPRDLHQTYDANLYEAYLRWAKGAWALEGGERVIRWGVMEYVSPTDAINPKDLRRIIDPDVEDTYLPVPILRTIYENKPWSLEGFYQPFFRDSKFDFFGTDASIYRPYLTSQLGVPFVDFGGQTDDSFENQISNLIAKHPDDQPHHGEGGMRISYKFQEIDLSLVYLNKRETLPSLTLPQGAASINPTSFASGQRVGSFPRKHMGGLTFRWMTDHGFTLKGEALLQHRSTFYDSQLLRTRESNLIWTAGVDYDFNFEHFFTIEYGEDHIFDESKSYFLREKTDRSLSHAAIFNFDARTWTIELKGTTILNQQAYWIRPKMIYRPSPPWELSIGANFLGGSNNSLFGLFSNNDQFFVAAKYLF